MRFSFGYAMSDNKYAWTIPGVRKFGNKSSKVFSPVLRLKNPDPSLKVLVFPSMIFYLT